MKKIYFLLFTLFISIASIGQTTVFQESFEAGNSGTPSETCTDNGGDFFTVTDGTDVAAYNVSGADGTFFFAAQDTDGTPCTMPVETLTFTGIDISTYTDMTFAALVAEDDSSDGLQDWDADTFVLFEINIDGAGYTNLFRFSGGGATNTEPGLDTNYDGIADGTLLTSVFQEFTAAVGTGTSADIRITFNNLNAGDEDIAIDNIRIIDGFAVTPSISVTAPVGGTVFAPGTTSVNVEWVTANLAGGESVNITVNGMGFTGVTSPYAVATTDGMTYNITVDLVNAGGTIDSGMTDFSIGSSTSVTDIAALRADVTTNGTGGFYEITGPVLVTHTDGFNNRHWIQDGNISGILIYDSADVIITPYAVGDNVTGLKGSTAEVNGILRFIPSEDSGVVASSGNAVTPQIITIPTYTANYEDYESELIELQSVSFMEGDGVATFATGTNYTVTDGVNTVVKRTDFFSADYIGTLIPSTQLASLVAVGGEFNTTPQIYVRNLNDITLNTPDLDLNSFSVYPNPTTLGFVNIKTTSGSDMNVQVFDILGKNVLSQSIDNEKLDVSSLKTGVYIMRISQNNNTATKKLVIK